MKRNILILSMLIFAVPMFSSCAALIIGGAAGYEVSSDSVKAEVDTSYDRAYDAGLETLRAIDGLSVDNKNEGWIKSELNNFNVAVHVEKLTEKTSKITVSARKFALPKSQYARDVLAKILMRVKQQPFWMR